MFIVCEGARDCVMKLTPNGAVLHKIPLPDHMKTTASAFSRVTLLMEVCVTTESALSKYDNPLPKIFIIVIDIYFYA